MEILTNIFLKITEMILTVLLNSFMILLVKNFQACTISIFLIEQDSVSAEYSNSTEFLSDTDEEETIMILKSLLCSKECLKYALNLI